MSPEMIKAHFAWFASDLWGLGWIIFEWLTGSPPFADKSSFEIEESIWNDKIQFPSKFDKLAKDLIIKLTK